MSLKEYPTDLLEEELEKRKIEVPEQRKEIDWTIILRKLEKYMEYVKVHRTEHITGEEIEYSLFEMLINCVYGDKGFDFIKTMTEEE